ncbi:hypothetical protein VNO77_27533 [Canavalia gladiata]|uniref:Uncharacterized protein n=1 Tax=Canavalia gladiata TaxID=3824 RepID=A0AAN9KUB1_CANGL
MQALANHFCLIQVGLSEMEIIESTNFYIKSLTMGKERMHVLPPTRSEEVLVSCRCLAALSCFDIVLECSELQPDNDVFIELIPIVPKLTTLLTALLVKYLSTTTFSLPSALRRIIRRINLAATGKDLMDDMNREIDEYMDALTTMESELETDNEFRPQKRLKTQHPISFPKLLSCKRLIVVTHDDAHVQEEMIFDSGPLFSSLHLMNSRYLLHSDPRATSPMSQPIETQSDETLSILVESNPRLEEDDDGKYLVEATSGLVHCSEFLILLRIAFPLASTYLNPLEKPQAVMFIFNFAAISYHACICQGLQHLHQRQIQQQLVRHNDQQPAQSMTQSQLQVIQMQSHDDPMDSQLQTTNVQGSIAIPQ